MLRHLALTALLLVCCGCKPQPAQSGRATQDLAATDPAYIAEDPALQKLVGRPGPSLVLKGMDGNDMDLAKIYGTRPVYLKLWATYCIPCRFQMPGLKSLFKSHGDKIQFIAVNAGVGDDDAKVRAFAKEYGLEMPVAMDDGSLGAWLNMRATPVHLVMARNGEILFAGHQDGPKLEAALEKAIRTADSGHGLEDAKVMVLPRTGLGETPPAFDLLTADGQTYHYPQATTRPRAILFTSVWCESYLQQTEPKTVQACKRVREEADRLAPAGSVDWLGVVTAMWTTPENLAKYEKQKQPKIPMMLDQDGTAFRAFGIHRLPAVALISADGKLARLLGPDDTDLADAVAQLAEKKPE